MAGSIGHYYIRSRWAGLVSCADYVVGRALFDLQSIMCTKGVNSFSAAIAAISSKMWARKDLKRLFLLFLLASSAQTTQLDDTKRDLERKGNVPVVGHLSSYY